MSVPPMRWTAGLLLAILSIIPATLSAQAAGRSVRSAGSTSIGTASATRAVGIATVGASRVSGMLESERAEARESRTKARESKTVIGYEARFGVGVRPRAAGTPQDDVGAEPTGEVSSVPPAPPPVHETTTLAWKPGGIRITGWTDDARPGAMATVKRPDCAAPGLDARCVPENLYAAPPPSGVVATSILAVPLAGPIYPLSYSYYYGLPFPALALSSNTFSMGPTPCPQSPPQTPTRRAQQRKRSSRLFGWLYRSVRNVDMEKSSAPLLFYLRSPLLAGFGDDMDCPQPAESAVEEVETCAIITVRAEKEVPRVAQVALPVLDAYDSDDLRDALESRLIAGEAIVMSTLDGKALLLSPNHVREFDVRACEPVDAGYEEDAMPTFAY